MNFLRRAVRSISYQDVWGSDSPQGGWRAVANPNTPEHILRLAAAYGCVRLLADSISMLPVGAFREGDGELVRMPKPPALFVRPGQYGTRFDWTHRLMVSLLLRGNGYGLPYAVDRAGYPTAIEWISPDYVVVQQMPLGGRPTYFVAGEDMTASIVHIPAFVLPGRAEGLSPIAYFRTLFETGLSAEEFGASFFRDGAHPSSVLESASPIDKPTAEQIKERFVAALGRRREPVVLGKGLTWKPIQIAPEESQFLATIKATATQVAVIFGVPPERVGGTPGGSMTYANIEQSSLDFTTYSIMPWTVRLEEALTALTPRPQLIRFDLDALVRPDLAARMEAEKVRLLYGFGCADEARRRENQPPLPNGEGQKFNWPPGPHPAESPKDTALPTSGPAPNGKKPPAPAPVPVGGAK